MTLRYVWATTTAAVGTRRVVYGETWWADDPIVKANPSLFTDDPRKAGLQASMGLGSFQDDPVYVDHVDGNGLNNHRKNLRIVSHPQNLANTGSRGGTSKFKGVSWHAEKGRWGAGIMIDGRFKLLGRYDDEEQAALAYNLAAKEAWGEHAHLNQVDPSVTLPPPRTYSSRYRGVSWVQKYARWRAGIRVDGKLHALGQYKDEREAALAYNAGATRLLGDKAKLNEVPDA